MSHFLTSCHVTPCDLMSRNVTSCPVTSHHITWCQVISNHVTSRHVTSCHSNSWFVTSHHITSRHVASCEACQAVTSFTSNLQKFSTAEQCHAACQGENDCNYWNWDDNTNVCQAYAAVQSKPNNYRQKVRAGPKYCPSSKTP